MTFVLFGAYGDLAKRKIYPALFNLFLNQKLPDTFRVIGVGINESSDEMFKEHVKESLYTFSRHLINDLAKKDEFLQMFSFCQLDFTDRDAYNKLLDVVKQNEQLYHTLGNRMFYLSVAPEFFSVITSNLKESGLDQTTGWKRIIVEKPFGYDLRTAQVLNKKLGEVFVEEEIFRIDHYLGKPMIQSLEALERANPVLMALWNNKLIANVQISASETVGVEDRAGYYDQSGAIRDMVQNHMLQLVMMTAMHLTGDTGAAEVRNEKRKVLEALRPLNRDNVEMHVVRGQYTAGEINGSPTVGYVEEPEISTHSQNDTFIAARLWIDNPFWQGVPFYIRTGKRLMEKSTQITIEFKSPIQDTEGNQAQVHSLEPNLLVINVSPTEGLSLQLNIKNPLSGRLEPVIVDFASSQEDVPEAYELLLHDAMCGDATFFAHWDEVELSWRWVQPILNAFKSETVPLHLYPSGTMGPEAADQLLAEDGYNWW